LVRHRNFLLKYQKQQGTISSQLPSTPTAIVKNPAWPERLAGPRSAGQTEHHHHHWKAHAEGPFLALDLESFMQAQPEKPSLLPDCANVTVFFVSVNVT
jgi:hypothetical protein